MNIVDELRAQANQHPLDVDLIMFDVAATKIDQLKQQRDELLAALKDTVEIIYGLHSDPEVLNAYKVHYDNDDTLRAETVIKNAEGGK